MNDFLKNLREARDARVGAIGVENIRQMYSDGNIEDAQAMAQALTQANIIGTTIPLGLNTARISSTARNAMDLAGTINGFRNVVSDNGIKKTIRKAKEGDTWGAIRSGMGDLLDIAAVGDLTHTIYKNRIPLSIELDQSLGRTFKKVPKTKMPLNVGWGPAEKSSWYHQSNEPIEKFTFPNKNNWVVKTHNAPSNVIYMAGKPASSGFLAKRPYTSKWEVNIRKPIVQIGELQTEGKNAGRNALLRYADNAGADAVIFNGIKDNQLTNQRILADLDGNNYKKVYEYTHKPLIKSETNNFIFKRPDNIKNITQKLSLPDYSDKINLTKNHQLLQRERWLDPRNDKYDLKGSQIPIYTNNFYYRKPINEKILKLKKDSNANWENIDIPGRFFLDDKSIIYRGNPAYIDYSKTNKELSEINNKRITELVNIRGPKIGYSNNQNYEYKNGDLYAYNPNIIMDLNYKNNLGIIEAHEESHLYDNLLRSPKQRKEMQFSFKELDADGLKTVKDERKDYMTRRGSTEMYARYNQLKNYFGKKYGEPLTVDEYLYAVGEGQYHYPKDINMDNGMKEFSLLIGNKGNTREQRENIAKRLAKLEKYTPAIVIGTIGTSFVNSNNKDNK